MLLVDLQRKKDLVDLHTDLSKYKTLILALLTIAFSDHHKLLPLVGLSFHLRSIFNSSRGAT